MNMKIFLTAAIGLCLFASCNSDDPEVPNHKDPSTTDATAVKHFEAEASAYDSWMYVNLEKGTFVVQKELGEWEYRKFIFEGGQFKLDENGNRVYEVERTVAATGSENDRPKDWDLAFHVYDPRINNGSCLMTEATDLAAITTFPEGEYKTDKAVDIIIDMKGMMSGVMGYAKSYANMEMNKWLKSTGMGKPKTLSDKVFAVKFDNGNRALIKFKEYLDATGKKKVVSFDYKFIKK